MERFLSRPHPWLMQALGSLIAVVVFVPIAAYVFVNVVNRQTEKPFAPLAPPSAAQPGASASGSAQPGAGGATVTVKMQPSPSGSYVFSPSKLTIHVGQTVQWIDANGVPHNIVGLGTAASVISRPAINTDSYSVTFANRGIYHYECQVHLPTMVGTITVT